MAYNPYLGAAGGGASGFAGSLWQNPSDQANKDIQNIPGYYHQYLDPYYQTGIDQSKLLRDQYGNLTRNAPGILNDIGKGYQQSPGFKFALQQALQGAGHAAAAGGMAGSPQHEQQNMQIATGLANQDFNQWMQNALGLYGTGLQGEQNLYNTGFESGKDITSGLSNADLQKAILDYMGTQSNNLFKSDLLKGGLNLAGNLLGGGAGGGGY